MGIEKLFLLPIQKVLIIEYLQFSHIFSQDPVTAGNQARFLEQDNTEITILSILWDENFAG